MSPRQIRTKSLSLPVTPARHLMPGVEVADIDALRGQHQPPRASLRRQVREPESDHGPAGGHQLEVDIAVQVAALDAAQADLGRRFDRGSGSTVLD